MLRGHALRLARRSVAALTTAIQPFHLAIPVHSVAEARKFYGSVLGCTEGRRDGDMWQDYNFFGHQLVCHHASDVYRATDHFNGVDKCDVPVPHFGVCLTTPQFRALARRLQQRRIEFVVPPQRRFAGAPGEQLIMFFKDPSGNNLEFKAMKKPHNLYARYDVGSLSATPKKRRSLPAAPCRPKSKKEKKKKKK